MAYLLVQLTEGLHFIHRDCKKRHVSRWTSRKTQGSFLSFLSCKKGDQVLTGSLLSQDTGILICCSSFELLRGHTTHAKELSQDHQPQLWFSSMKVITTGRIAGRSTLKAPISKRRKALASTRQKGQAIRGSFKGKTIDNNSATNTGSSWVGRSARRIERDRNETESMKCGILQSPTFVAEEPRGHGHGRRTKRQQAHICREPYITGAKCRQPVQALTCILATGFGHTLPLFSNAPPDSIQIQATCCVRLSAASSSLQLCLSYTYSRDASCVQTMSCHIYTWRAIRTGIQL